MEVGLDIRRSFLVGVSSGEGDHGIAVREHHAAQVRGPLDRFDARYGTCGEKAEDRLRAEGASAGQTQPNALRDVAGPVPDPLTDGCFGHAGAQPTWGVGEDLLQGRIALAHARKAGGKGDLGDGQRRRLEQDTSRLSPLGPCDRQRPGAHFGSDDAVQLANAVAQTPGNPFHAVSVHRSISDESHGPGSCVRSQVPFGRARGRIGPAAQACSKARLLSRGGGGVEAHVLPFGCAGRTAGATVDPGRGHADEEDAVEAGVFAVRRLVTAFGIFDHPRMISRRGREYWRKSDISVDVHSDDDEPASARGGGGWSHRPMPWREPRSAS